MRARSLARGRIVRETRNTERIGVRSIRVGIDVGGAAFGATEPKTRTLRATYCVASCVMTSLAAVRRSQRDEGAWRCACWVGLPCATGDGRRPTTRRSSAATAASATSCLTGRCSIRYLLPPGSRQPSGATTTATAHTALLRYLVPAAFHSRRLNLPFQVTQHRATRSVRYPKFSS